MLDACEAYRSGETQLFYDPQQIAPIIAAAAIATDGKSRAASSAGSGLADSSAATGSAVSPARKSSGGGDVDLIEESDLDAAILCRGGVEECIRALKALQREGKKVHTFHELLPALVNLPEHALIKSRPATPQPLALTSDTSNAAASTSLPASVASGSLLSVPSPSTPVPPPPSSAAATVVDNSALHDQLLEYLGGSSVTLFAPLADAELEISVEELDGIIAGANHSIYAAIEICRRLQQQGKGFTSMGELACAVAAEYQIVTNQALASL